MKVFNKYEIKTLAKLYWDIEELNKKARMEFESTWSISKKTKKNYRVCKEIMINLQKNSVDNKI